MPACLPVFQYVWVLQGTTCLESSSKHQVCAHTQAADAHTAQLTLGHDKLFRRRVAGVQHAIQGVEVDACAHVYRGPKVDDLDLFLYMCAQAHVHVPVILTCKITCLCALPAGSFCTHALGKRQS